MSTFSNTINSQITITPVGEYGCGPTRGEPVTFDVTIDVEANELDHRGFVVDVFAVKQILDYRFNGASTESGELLVQRVVDELWDDERLTKVTATIKSVDFATIKFSRERDLEDEDADDEEEEDDFDDEEDELEARSDGEIDPIEQLDNDDAKQPSPEPSPTGDPAFDEISTLVAALAALTQPAGHRQTQPRVIDLGGGLRAIAIPVGRPHPASPEALLNALLGG